MSDQHTKEPWHADGWRGIVQGVGSFDGIHSAVWAADNDTMICPTGLDGESEANALRIVACVNYCKGISNDCMNDDMEQGVNAKDQIDGYDELQSKLDSANKVIEQQKAALEAIAGETYDAWSNGAKAKEIAQSAINQSEATK